MATAEGIRALGVAVSDGRPVPKLLGVPKLRRVAAFGVPPGVFVPVPPDELLESGREGLSEPRMRVGLPRPMPVFVGLPGGAVFFDRAESC